ncbi:MAG TPA: phosphoglycerate mutase family protein [Vicinamibacterales bacterium]|nr:phosphoglycerate mutase family protein [Vicinamibacterales bacterium]
MKVLLAAMMLAVSVPGVSAQGAVFLVRHAERADMGTAAAATMSPDPELSPTGHQRAESLAAMLRDARVTAIFASEFKRTQQTAAPLAKALGLDVTTVKSNEPHRLLQLVRAATGNVLVVGHSNTVPDIIQGLGVSDRVTIAETEYDNLFVVSPGSPPRMIRLRYR